MGYFFSSTENNCIAMIKKGNFDERLALGQIVEGV
jgi:hypothetical protein